MTSADTGPTFARRLLREWFGETPIAVVLPDGRTASINGAERATAPLVLVYRTWRTVARMGLNAALAFGEAWTDGDMLLERGSLADLLFAIGPNLQRRQEAGGIARSVRRRWENLVRQANPRAGARRNAAHHYDLSLELYRLFLDEDLQYSCAYFARPDMTLEEAQDAKKRLIAAKLDLRRGSRVLDIGCGWGGLGMMLAEDYGAEVTGVTLSAEQLKVAQERARQRGLSKRARFELTDYRDVRGPFDRIVSVGMFEHVGRPNYDAYFQAVAGLLTDDGVAVIHSIGRSTPPAPAQPWMDRYIFPGGYAPSLSEVLPAVERAGLTVTDVEILRLHYAETLRCWRERFEARRGEIEALYDARFARMWEFYLVASEAAFRFNRHMVFQLQLTKRVDALPITRAPTAAAVVELEAQPAFRSVTAA